MSDPITVLCKALQRKKSQIIPLTSKASSLALPFPPVSLLWPRIPLSLSTRSQPSLHTGTALETLKATHVSALEIFICSAWALRLKSFPDNPNMH